jgi:predicted RNase H-like HicB family nuclease
MDMFVFTGLIFQEDGSYSALCPELDVASQGATIEDAKQMLLEAATLHMEGAIQVTLTRKSCAQFSVKRS